MNKIAFVLMPFAPEFDAAYRLFIKTALEEAGFDVKRADDLLNQRNIMQDVMHGIDSANLVIADLTGSNPNVFYELGIAHALEKPVILLTQSLEELPFDLRSYRVLEYQTHFARIEHARLELVKLAQSAHSGSAIFGNPVTDFRANTDRAIEASPANSRVISSTAITEDDRGLVDHLIDIQEGYGELAQLIGRITAATGRITPEAQELAAGITRANATGGQLAPSQIRFLCQKYAASLGVYTSEIQLVNDDYENLSTRIQDSLEFIARFQHATNRDETQLTTFLNSMVGTRASAAGARDAFATTRDTLAGSLEFERSLRRSGVAAMAELDRLVSNISRTVSSIDRAIEAAGGKPGGPTS
jgi:hypothetical protein